MIQHELDARRMLCPMPVIRTQDAIAKLNKGDILEVICTDPGALNDISAWCRINGHQVVATSENDDEITIKIEVCGLES